MAQPTDSRPRFQSFEIKSEPEKVAPRVKALRAELRANNLDAFLVPRENAHQGESVPASDARLGYLTGFTGSAGLAIVGLRKAGLFVDGRYTLQAPLQTDTKLFTVIETPNAAGSPRLADFVGKGGRVGYDPWLHTPSAIAAMSKVFDGKATLVPVDNLVDRIWTDRPAPPAAPVEFLGHNRAGRDAADKLAELRRALVEAGADATVLTVPESINWLFNMRGRDVPNVPVLLCFALVPAKGMPTLFVDRAKLTAELRQGLKGVAKVADVDGMIAALRRLGAGDKTVWIDPATVPVAVANAISSVSEARLLEQRDPVVLPKARKNAAELGGMREAHRLDGAAFARFLHWFDQAAPKGGLDEIGIVEALEDFRRREPSVVDASFDTIAGAGPNGAIVHYRVDTASNRRLMPGELMLLDSGAQYLSGTTDITRTLYTGSATEEQKDRYTRVLKGMIAIARARFPKGTTGAQIDALARQFLWAEGLNYNHGTGHGVGAFLSVHEGPAGISSRYTTPLEASMVISDEPGFYQPGEYGIRIENLVIVEPSPVGADFLQFETLTLAPIETRLIDITLLEAAERDWLNAYHARVLAEIGPLVEPEVRSWLQRATAPI